MSYIANNGLITVEKLYAAPFSTLHAEGIDGIFKIDQADEFFALLKAVHAESNVRTSSKYE